MNHVQQRVAVLVLAYSEEDIAETIRTTSPCKGQHYEYQIAYNSVTFQQLMQQ